MTMAKACLFQSNQWSSASISTFDRIKRVKSHNSPLEKLWRLYFGMRGEKFRQSWKDKKPQPSREYSLESNLTVMKRHSPRQTLILKQKVKVKGQTSRVVSKRWNIAIIRISASMTTMLYRKIEFCKKFIM